MAATAKKLGQQGLAQLGRLTNLTRRSKHGDHGQSDQRDSGYKPNVGIEEALSSVTAGFSSSELRIDDNSEASGVSSRLKSSSLCDIPSGESSINVEQDDIMDLTQQVKSFSDALSSLKILFTAQDFDAGSDLNQLAHTRLGDVVGILKAVLSEYQSLNSTDVFIFASQLISKIKNLNECDDTSRLGGDTGGDTQIICDIIDQLALAFSTSVSDYLMGDQPEDITTVLPARTKSYESLRMAPRDDVPPGEPRKTTMRVPQNIDDALCQMDIGVDVALQRAKSWSKYAKDVMTYVDRKAHYEAEFAKNLSRLANSMRPAICEEGFLPLQGEYFISLENDQAYASTYQAATSALLAHKFIEPLNSRRADHEKVRKSLKDQWNKELKRMEQAVNSLKNAKAMYIQRRQEYERSCELSQKIESEMLGQSGGTASSKVDKRKKAEEDAMHKAAEAETTYKACVAEANMRQAEIARVKKDVLSQLHEQIIFGDKVLKKVTQDYFQLEHATNLPMPARYYDLYEKCELYEAGSQYAQFVGHITPAPLSPIFSEPFIFEAYQSYRGAQRKSSNHSTGSIGHSHNNSPLATKGAHRPLVRAWSQGMGSDSESASSSNKSMDSSPSASPLADLKVARHSMSDVAEEDNLNDSGIGADRNLKSKKENSDFVGICKRLGNRRGTFGVDFSEQVLSLKMDVPPIVTQCLLEIELRGLTTKGIYRVSGVKSKVEALCQRFEMSPGRVDIREDNPVVISNVLKLYLRQLPEPLLTFALYADFIRIAKDDMSGKVDPSLTIDSLNELVSLLPQSNFHTTAVLMHHLKRVTNHVEDNQMNANNLGIVFGPTLLRPREGPTSLTALVDTPHQTRAVEMLVSAAEKIFGPPTNLAIIPDPGENPPLHAPLTQCYTASMAGEPTAGASPHRPLRRSSSTPIGEVSFHDFSSSKAPEGNQSPAPNIQAETDDGDSGGESDDWVEIELHDVLPFTLSAEMRDIVSRQNFELYRPRNDQSVPAEKSPINQKTRLAKSLEIKAKFLLGAEGELESDTSSQAETGDTQSETGIKSDQVFVADSSVVKPPRPLSASLSEAKAKFLLGSITVDIDDTNTPGSPKTSAHYASRSDGRVEPRAATDGTDDVNTARGRITSPRYRESEASESSMPVSPSKCILTVPRPYPGLSNSPTPAPKLRLPPGAMSPTLSRTPSPNMTDSPRSPRSTGDTQESQGRYLAGNIGGNIGRMSPYMDDTNKLSDDDDDDISYV